MSRNHAVWRRTIGAVVLGTAMLMLIAGETLLKDRLGPAAFVLYWSVCLMLTAVAIAAAFLDLRALRQKTREEHRELLETTLQELERKHQNRTRPKWPAGAAPPGPERAPRKIK